MLDQNPFATSYLLGWWIALNETLNLWHSVSG